MNNLKKLIVLSWKNIKSHKWLYAKMTIAFACLVFMICLFSAYAFALSETQDNMKNKSVSANYFISNEEINELSGEEAFELKHYDFAPRIEEWFSHNADFLTASNVSVIFGGQKFNALEDYKWQEIKVFAGTKLITENDIKELKLSYGTTTCIIGELPKTADEVLVSEVFLEYYDLTTDILGQSISLYVNNKDNMVILDTVKICGIICAEYFNLTGHFDLITPTLFLAENNSLFNDTKNTKTEYIYSLDSWINTKEMDMFTEKYDCTYSGSYVLSQIELTENMQLIALNLFIIIGVSLGLGLLLMIFLMMDKLIQVFSRDGGILLTSGMEKKELNKLLYIILLWVCLFAFILAAVLTVIAFYAINALISSFYRITITLSFPVIALLFLVGIASVLIIASAYYLYSICQMRKRTIKELLTTQI